MQSPVSASVQDYLKAIYEIREEHERVSTNALADKLGVAAASVTGMLKKLADIKLVDYEQYKGVRLTVAGEKMALEIIRHHRLLELYLHEAMGYDIDKVHAEAERMEHAISEEFEERMSRLLGDPSVDPHGDPIPTKGGEVAERSRLALSDIEPGRTVVIERVRDKDARALREIATIGLLPKRSVTVVDVQAESGVLHVSIDGAPPVQVTLDLACGVFVR